MEEGNPAVPHDLSRKLVTRINCDKRIPSQTAAAISDLIQVFVLEARSRASIEAECDVEGSFNDEGLERAGAADSTKPVVIRADHITKIAAEMLMDFS